MLHDSLKDRVDICNHVRQLVQDGAFVTPFGKIQKVSSFFGTIN